VNLANIWFLLIGVLFIGYAIFDGFDLGIGTLYPFLGKSEQDKAIMRRAVGPVWDGNEVWLLPAGGALSAAFPPVYATVFSGFYLALMLLLFALIFRAASLEFRHSDPAWAKFWDSAFFVGSALPALLFGVAVGNIIRGVPLTGGEFIAGGGEPVFLGNLLVALNPFSLVIGVLGLVWIIWHGASWLALKTMGDLHDRAVRTHRTMTVLFAVVFALATAATALLVPDAFAKVTGSPVGWLFVVLVIAGAIMAWVARRRGADLSAFYGSALAVVGMVGIWATSIYPYLVPTVSEQGWTAGSATRVAEGGLTVANSSSSDLTLTVMLIIAGIGVPLVLFYFFLIYKTFAGRIEPVSVEGESGY
jgi:cytochrome bd ubiquinol oxidase subunit II